VAQVQALTDEGKKLSGALLSCEQDVARAEQSRKQLEDRV
jgi:hypothetical protein